MLGLSAWNWKKFKLGMCIACKHSMQYFYIYKPLISFKFSANELGNLEEDGAVTSSSAKYRILDIVVSIEQYWSIGYPVQYKCSSLKYRNNLNHRCFV